jgi:hypothetical protein
MANFSDLIGAYLQNAATPSGQNRMGNVLQTLEKAGPGGAGVPGAAAGGLLGGVLDAIQKGLAGAARNPAQAGGDGCDPWRSARRRRWLRQGRAGSRGGCIVPSISMPSSPRSAAQR